MWYSQPHDISDCNSAGWLTVMQDGTWALDLGARMWLRICDNEGGVAGAHPFAICVRSLFTTVGLPSTDAMSCKRPSHLVSEVSTA